MADRKPYLLPINGELNEPELLFHPTDLTQASIHPLEGLLSFGPYSSSNPLFSGPLKIAIITPDNSDAKARQLLSLLNGKHEPYYAKEYFRAYPGFKEVFKKDLTIVRHITLPLDSQEQITKAPNPRSTLFNLYKDAINSLRGVYDFDLALIFIPNQWKNFTADTETDFDLHDKIKAFSASQNVYCQVVEEWGDVFTPSDKCAVAWALSIALYTKAGGTPWTLKNFDESRAYIGIGYAMRRNPVDGKRFVICCSQIFDAKGQGLNFVIFEANAADITGTDSNDNPFLSKSTMRKIMSRSLDIYLQKQKHREAPRKISVHKTNQFTPEEIEACTEAFYGFEDIELIHIQKKNDWKGIRVTGKGQNDMNACRRGTYVPLEDDTALLWSQGAVMLPGQRYPYYKEKRAVPNPLLLHKSLGNTGWGTGCENILRLTKMNWNTEKLYNTMPVTIKCAQRLAEVIKHSEHFSQTEYDYTLFM